MLLDYEIANCTRRCAATGRALAPGENYWATLHMERGAPVRRDYALDAWQGAPADAIAWWRSQLEGGDGARAKLAPQDVLLNLLAALADEPAETEFRYVLGLLLLRRRLVKLVDTVTVGAEQTLTLDCPRREEQFQLRVAMPAAERQAELERRLVELVYGGPA
jgi:hypothetical protein